MQRAVVRMATRETHHLDRPSLAAQCGPRERLWLYGPERLSDADLLAVLLGTGTTGEPVQVLAERILATAGGLHQLSQLGEADLAGFVGVGRGKASRLWAAIELGMRAASVPLHRGRPIRSSQDVDRALRPRLRRETREHFVAIPVDVRNRPLAEITVAIGGLSACELSPASVFRPILSLPAHGVIFVHNHPSGEPQPSEEDIQVTVRLSRAGELLGVPILDHVIIGAEESYSFLDQGLLARIHPQGAR
ncbi:MAG: DNA repair protein RadC [Myxococcales bacterium]|nr:DNA repair protein RadC [Myxococcales bacterium]MDD9968634.1 DNA repair protein RadC [Myxococcales bacterium]